jgi:hypothetical protein
MSVSRKNADFSLHAFLAESMGFRFYFRFDEADTRHVTLNGAPAQATRALHLEPTP